MDHVVTDDNLSSRPESDQLAPTPKQLRRKAHFGEPNLTAAAVVPPYAQPDQVISTLIDSLAAITNSRREQTTDNPYGGLHPHAEAEEDQEDRPGTPESIYADIPIERLASIAEPAEDQADDGDEDVAVPPTIRMARVPPTSMERRRRETVYSYISTILPERKASLRHSGQSMRSARSQDSGMGVPSIERPNGSTTSLALSTSNSHSRSRSASKTRQLEPSSNGTSVRPGPRRSYSDFGILGTAVSKDNLEQEKENNTPRSSFDASRRSSRRASATPSMEAHMINALNPLNRADLQEHLIPSRRSSIRQSSSGETKEAYRHSMEGRDLKDLNIDEELLGSEDSTVRRIRELQEAREKRQLEWRKEARRSVERTTKRHSAPSPKSLQRNSLYQGSKLSVTEVLVESEQESTPDVSATMSGNDLGLMPATTPQDEPLTPLAPPPEFSRQLSPSPAPVVPKNSPGKGSRPPSAQNKRVSTFSSHTRESANDPVKSISEEVETFLSSPRLTQKIRHPRTGRTIAFSEVGDPNGFVVLCCIGMGLTRYITTFYHELAITLKLRLITPDRPGVGESESVPERLNNPLTWVDDVAVICHALEVQRFSLLAHSAGTIYALATALKMPQFVRGRIHLLAPWVPPSQMPKGAAIGPDSQPIASMPMSHRLLSVIPSSMLKVANSRFLSATTASESKSLRGKKPKNLDNLEAQFSHSFSDLNDPSLERMFAPSMTSSMHINGSMRTVSCYQANNDNLNTHGLLGPAPSIETRSISARSLTSPPPTSPRITSEARAAMYDKALTHRIWHLSTLNANPATDLMTCFERKKTIGFRYAEVTRSVVIHHGAKDNRVPLDNVRWLHSIMKRCDLRILPEEGHSLMASATVMSNVLTEVAREWEEWRRIADGKEKKKREIREDAAGAMSMRSVNGSVSVRS